MREQHHTPRGALAYWRLGIVVLAALAITAAVFWQTRRTQLTRFRSQFEGDAAARTALIMQETDKSLFAIKSLGWFFDGSEHVDAKEFQAFVAACLAERKELQALSWNLRVSAAERAGFEQRAQREGRDQFRITERNPDGRFIAARERETYYPVFYIEPRRGNEAALGFDVGSDAVRRAALERARDTGEPTATEPIQLVQQEGGGAGFLIFVPVYREGMPKANVQERRAALEGFAVGVYQVRTLVATALRGVEPMGLSLTLLDRSAPAGRQLMDRRDETLTKDRSWKTILFPAPPRATSTHAFAGRQWGVEMVAGPAYMERYCPISYWLVLPAGLLLGLLAMGYLGAVLSGRERLAQLVEERTAALGQAQDMLRLVLDAIPVRVHWKDRDSVYLGCNRRFAQDAELDSPEEIAGKTDFDLPWKEFAELYRGRDRQVIQSGRPMPDYEQPRSTRDGRVLCLLQSKLPLRDARGNIIGVLSVYEDITKRKQDEAALRESETRYRTVVENSPDGMAVAVENKLVYVNPAAVRLAGAREAADLLGRSILEFVHEDFRAEVERRRAKILETGLPAPIMEAKLRRPDGRIIDAESMAVPIVYGGKPAILNSFRDMTEHRRRAQALRAIVNATAGSGEDFFRALVAELGKVLGVKHALAGVLMPGVPERVRTVALWRQGAIVENGEYELNGTLCGNVVSQGLCHYPSDVQTRFPHDKMLADMGVVSCLGIPLYSSSGAALGLLCVMDDQPMPNSELAKSLMTIFAARAAAELEREEALKGLKASEARYRRLHESMMDAFVAGDLNGQLTDCNETFRRMLGYEPEEIRKLNSKDWTPEKWHALDAEIRRTQVLARGYSDIYEKEYRRKDGTVFPVELRVILLRDDAGTPYGLWAIVRDITERKQAEETLRQSREQLRQWAEELETIMGSAPVALWVAHDPQCNYISGNRMASSFDEASSQANWSANVSSALRWFRDGRELKPEELPMQQAALNNTEIHNTEMELLLQSGRRISLLGSATPLRDAHGRVRGCVGAFLDNTERKRAVEGLRRARNELEQRVRERTAELVQANERLQELDRLKSQFLSTMSHELRTPLNSIIGFTGILRQGFAGPVTAEQKKQLELVFASAKHLLSLINDLLDLSRIEAGKVEVEREPFDFAEVVAEVVQSLTPMASQKQLRLVSELPAPAVAVVGDRKRCFQVLLNLANNAVKFTPRGQVKITAWTQADQLRVTVADTGIGIKPEQMGLLFEAFRQLDGSAKRLYEGTGLGLHLCRKLLALMGGEISVESEFGQGSRFTFTLPRRLDKPPEADPG